MQESAVYLLIRLLLLRLLLLALELIQWYLALSLLFLNFLERVREKRSITTQKYRKIYKWRAREKTTHSTICFAVSDSIHFAASQHMISNRLSLSLNFKKISSSFVFDIRVSFVLFVILTYIVILIGDSGVGKTNIFLRYLNNDFEQKSLSTIGVDFGSRSYVIDGNLCKVQIWDTAGQDRFKSISTSYDDILHTYIFLILFV